MVSDVPNVFIGEVNCEEENELCSQQGVKSYPTIRLYPLQSSNLNTVAWVSLQKLWNNCLEKVHYLQLPGMRPATTKWNYIVHSVKYKIIGNCLKMNITSPAFKTIME